MSYSSPFQVSYDQRVRNRRQSVKAVQSKQVSRRNRRQNSKAEDHVLIKLPERAPTEDVPSGIDTPELPVAVIPVPEPSTEDTSSGIDTPEFPAAVIPVPEPSTDDVSVVVNTSKRADDSSKPRTQYDSEDESSADVITTAIITSNSFKRRAVPTFRIPKIKKPTVQSKLTIMDKSSSTGLKKKEHLRANTDNLTTRTPTVDNSKFTIGRPVDVDKINSSKKVLNSKKETALNKLSTRLIEGGTAIKNENQQGNRDKLNSRNTPPPSSLSTIRLPVHDGKGDKPVIAKKETVLNKLSTRFATEDGTSTPKNKLCKEKSGRKALDAETIKDRCTVRTNFEIELRKCNDMVPGQIIKAKAIQRVLFRLGCSSEEACLQNIYNIFGGKKSRCPTLSIVRSMERVLRLKSKKRRRRMMSILPTPECQNGTKSTDDVVQNTVHQPCPIARVKPILSSETIQTIPKIQGKLSTNYVHANVTGKHSFALISHIAVMLELTRSLGPSNLKSCDDEELVHRSLNEIKNNQDSKKYLNVIDSPEDIENEVPEVLKQVKNLLGCVKVKQPDRSSVSKHRCSHNLKSHLASCLAIRGSLPSLGTSGMSEEEIIEEHLFSLLNNDVCRDIMKIPQPYDVNRITSEVLKYMNDDKDSAAL